MLIFYIKEFVLEIKFQKKKLTLKLNGPHF